MSDDLRKIEVGEKILGFFVVRKIEQRVKEGQHYLSLEVGNSSGRINGTYWGDDAQELYKVLSQGSVVKIMGEGMEYGGKSWLSIQKIRLAEPNEVEIEQLLPKGRYSSDVLWKQVEKYINLLEDEWLKKLATSIFSDSEFRDKFLTYPAAKLWHGAYLGGLAEHTLRVTAVCKRVSEFYSPCRHDLLICGALLHDIGKVDELSIAGFFDYSVKGRLLGHTVLGVMRVVESASRIDGFPDELLDEVVHMILSHHGDAERGAAIRPMTIEAIILHHADLLDSQAAGVEHIIEKELPKGRQFSKYISLLNRFIYLDGYRNDTDE